MREAARQPGRFLSVNWESLAAFRPHSLTHYHHNNDRPPMRKLFVLDMDQLSADRFTKGYEMNARLVGSRQNIKHLGPNPTNSPKHPHYPTPSNSLFPNSKVIP